jgi:hypothetical protein
MGSVGFVKCGTDEEKEVWNEWWIGRAPRLVGEGRERSGLVGDVPDLGRIGGIRARDVGVVCSATYEGMGRIDTSSVVWMVGETPKGREDGV